MGTGVYYHLSEENKQNIEISGQKGHLFEKPKAEANNWSARQWHIVIAKINIVSSFH